MRALHVPAAGDQPRLSDLPVPTPGEGQVLVRVKAAGLNPFDNAVANGMMAAMMPHEYPVVIGRDAAGIVEAVGHGVTEVAAGDEVFGHVLLAPPIHAGTLADYAVLPAAAVSAKPAGLDFVTAAAIPLAGGAAVAVIDAIEAEPGQTVLVNGASGGVGSFVVQLLSARGITVVATGMDQDTEPRCHHTPGRAGCRRLAPGRRRDRAATGPGSRGAGDPGFGQRPRQDRRHHRRLTLRHRDGQ
jgi:NADPH:quinone reductase-like Zn-dependent oxidoreductase